MYLEIASPDREILISVQLSFELLGYSEVMKAIGMTIHFKAPVSTGHLKAVECLPPTPLKYLVSLSCFIRRNTELFISLIPFPTDEGDVNIDS